MSKKDVKIVEDGVLASLRYLYSKFLDHLSNEFSIVKDQEPEAVSPKVNRGTC